MVTQSPSFKTVSPMATSFPDTLIWRSLQPTMQHLPQPRATSAAWDVMPPLAVRIASAACMPWTSSGDVSSLIKMTCSPFLCHASASSAVKTTRPVAPPGPAGNPFANRVASFSDSASSMGWSNSSNCSGWTRMMAVCLSINPSLAISTAILIAAEPFRFPILVWSIHSRPS